MQSRYYDPVLHRFINADVYASTGQGFVGTNMFAYCLNNPAYYNDDKGSYSEGAIRSNSNNAAKVLAMAFGVVVGLAIAHAVEDDDITVYLGLKPRQ